MADENWLKIVSFFTNWDVSWFTSWDFLCSWQLPPCHGGDILLFITSSVFFVFVTTTKE